MCRGIIAALFCIASVSFAYTWVPYGNADVPVYDFLALPVQNIEILCGESGIIMYQTESWGVYGVSDLPARSASPLDSTNILVAMGNGSSEDGIYSFNTSNHTFENVWACSHPRCVDTVKLLPSHMGGGADGLYVSFNGKDWNGMETFDNVSVRSFGVSDSAVTIGTVSDIYVFDTNNRLQFGSPEVWGMLEYAAIDEASGIVASRRNADVFWIHNDSGDWPRLFALTSDAGHLGEYRIDGITNRDWEDMAIGYVDETDSYDLYIGEIGDNNHVHNTKKIYRVREPAVSASQPAVNDTLRNAETVPFVYSDNVNHNAETLLFDPVTRDVFIVTKGYGGGQDIVFRGESPLITTETMVFDSVATISFPSGGTAVGGDISPSGTAILIKTYAKMYLWSRNVGETVAESLNREPVAVPYTSEPQGEAVAWLADEMGYVTVSEEPGGNPAYLFAYGRECWDISDWNDGIVRDMQFISDDSLYAIGESGLWRSTDRGRTWYTEILSPHMSTVTVDSNGVVFTGWQNADRDSAGIAVWWQTLEALVSINNGLRNTLVHALVPCSMSLIACTDSGAALLNDYFAPMELSCRGGTGDTIILTWDTVPAAMAYALYMSPNAYDIPITSPFETVTAPDTSLVIDWIHETQDTTIYFTGAALNESNTTDTSNNAGGFDFDLP